jgi:hypothetical protein
MQIEKFESPRKIGILCKTFLGAIFTKAKYTFFKSV